MNSHRTPRSCASYQLGAAGNVGALVLGLPQPSWIASAKPDRFGQQWSDEE